MRIVSQSAPVSYSRFSAQAQLLLPAPHIAGLLTAGTIPSTAPIDTPLPYVFDRPALADLSQIQRARLFEATDILLEIAIEHLVGAFGENALRAAEVLFHRAAGGQSALRPVGPAAFHAEIDADWLTTIAEAKRIKPMSTAEAESTLDAIRARQTGSIA